MKKVVPVLTRNCQQGVEILAFRHPLASIQLVKGTIDLDEEYQQAAIRELFEESGLIAEPNPEFMGNLILKLNQQDWYFYLCTVQAEIPNIWTHHCMDDGGLNFKLFWYPLDQKPSEEWHGTFQEALDFIREYLNVELSDFKPATDIL